MLCGMRACENFGRCRRPHACERERDAVRQVPEGATRRAESDAGSSTYLWVEPALLADYYPASAAP